MNQITNLQGIDSLRSLDVLDVHSNRLEDAEGLTGTHGLRIANLGGAACGGAGGGGRILQG